MQISLEIFPLSARWLHVVVFQATAEASSQGAADDDDTGGHAVLTPVEDVPDEDGSCQRGQKTGSNVQVAGPREVGVWSDTVECHQSDDQNKTCKQNGRVIVNELFSWYFLVAKRHRYLNVYRLSVLVSVESFCLY